MTVDWVALAGAAIDLATEALGNSLYEELLYRAYLVPAAIALLGRHTSGDRAVIPAILGSQAIFALAHVPHRLAHDFSALELSGSIALVWAFGVIQSAIYLRSSNLWLVVAIHALSNEPALLTSPRA